jgi:hypothetical protein
VSTSNFNNQFNFGDTLQGSYPLTASISRIYVDQGTNISHFTFSEALSEENYTPAIGNKRYINALESSLGNYNYLSDHYRFKSTESGKVWDKGQQKINMITAPSIFYGKAMKKGSINLKYYVSGTLIGQLADTKANGELIEVSGANEGTVAGVVMYDHGIMLLTGSWDIDTQTSSRAQYEGATAGAVTPKWVNFGVGCPQPDAADKNTPGSVVSASYEVEFKGVNEIPTLTMLAHADRGEYNHSVNPTFTDYSTPHTASITTKKFINHTCDIKNIVKSSYTDHNEGFKRQTYISKIGIYDENRNLIAIASLATPVKKLEDRPLTFKMKLDF